MIYATYSLVILALILCSAFFSLAEMSFLLASPVTLRHWAEDEDNRSAAVALGMLDDANRVLTTINIGDTIVNLAAVMLGTWFFFVYYICFTFCFCICFVYDFFLIITYG